MKKRIALITIAVCLVAASLWAGQLQDKIKGVIAKAAAAPAGDSCTGSLLFSWHAEDLDVTVGAPQGCSAGDTEGTASSAAAISNTQSHDGTNSLSIPTGYDYVTFSSDIKSLTEGKIVLRVYWGAFVAGAYMMQASIDASNYLRVTSTGTDEARLAWSGNGTAITLTTTDANMSTGSWYTITARWNTADVNPNFSIQVCDTNNENCSTTISDNTNPTSMVGSLSTVTFGDVAGNGGNWFLDNIKIYNSDD